MKRDAMAALAAHNAARPVGVLMTPRAEATGDVAQALTGLKNDLSEVRENLMPKAEKALKDAERAGRVSEDTKAELDKLLVTFNESTQKVSKLEGTLEALETRNADLEQVVAQGRGGGGGAATTVGATVAEADDLKAWVANGMPGNFRTDVNAAITTAGGSGGGLIWSDRDEVPVNMARRQLRIRDLLDVVQTGAGVIDYTKQTTRANAAAAVAEEGAAPESSYGWTKAQVIVKKISHVTHISDEALADSAQLAGEIDGELRYGLDLAEENQILAGDGTGENLSGLITDATAFSAAAGLPDTDRIERLRLAVLQVVLNDYAADGMVLNPADWAAIELQRETATGKFIIGGPDAPAGPALWRLPVVESNSMTAGSWLVGAMRMAARLYDRMETEVLISSEHGTNFVDGMKTMKATKRLALAVRRAPSLVTGDFTFA
ncbi:phage major capsid protein [Roseovarius sp. MMSF_3281]|uniref:phage major capsid protein n=1 Tax=Roseovarius sp. MMSF_3281 TaxID=3046694 RepID=UPI00273F5FEB|nr:phage major capsid protein [Roseovarius sp. MMSF_3281]